jgi:hypothetical protein
MFWKVRPTGAVSMGFLTALFRTRPPLLLADSGPTPSLISLDRKRQSRLPAIVPP